MARRTKRSGELVKGRRPTTPKPAPRNAPEIEKRSKPSPVAEESEVARLADDEALELQKATAEVLRVISASPGELETVFQAMLERAVRICGAKFGNIYRWDDDALHLVASHNTPTAYAEHRRRLPLRFDQMPESLRRMVATKAPIQVDDIRTLLDGNEQHNPVVVAGTELGGIRTVLNVPMLKESNLVGAFVVSRQEVRPFNDKQIELVQNFAAQAVIAIENARLFKELRQRTTDLSEALDQQTATSEVLQVISSSSGNLQPVFAAMLDKAARICDANFGNIFRWDGDALRLVATHNTPTGFTEHRRRVPFRPNQGNPIGEMLKANTAIHVTDLARDERYITKSDPEVIAAVELGGIRTFIAVPMLKDEKLIGAVILYRQEAVSYTHLTLPTIYSV